MCEHNRLKCVGYKGVTRVFCCECGEELPMEFLTAGNDQKQAEKAAPDAGMGKPTRKKRTAQKAK